MSAKQDKQRFQENKIKSNKKAERYNENRFVDVDLGDIKVKVDRTGKYVNEREVKEVIKDLFYVGSKIEPQKKLSLSSVCDVYYDLVCDKIIGNEIRMRVC